MPLPLEGVRVVDFSRVLAGPHCAKTLLDLGAEVIKLEPPGGDLSRKAFPSQGQVSGYYAQQNAGKRNVSIDLNVPGAREAALRLCDTADVIVENFRPGALASFGLGYESVSARNPRVVYASISGYGQHGAWRSRMAYAPTVQAETGITANTADHFGRTATLRSDSLSHADVYSGLHAAIAILACLTERARTGQGQYIDVAMAAVMLSINERVHADLSDAELGAERPILGATDGPFFTGPHGERFASPMSLVGSMSFPFYLAAMRRPISAGTRDSARRRCGCATWTRCTGSSRSGSGPSRTWNHWTPSWTRRRSPPDGCAASGSSRTATGHASGTRCGP